MSQAGAEVKLDDFAPVFVIAARDKQVYDNETYA